MPQGLREMPEQPEVLCEGLVWVTPISLSSFPLLSSLSFRFLRSMLVLRAIWM